MEQQTVAALRFGYGLPLPAGAPTAPPAMLDALAGPDAMAARYPLPGTAEAMARMEAFDDAARDRRRARRAQMQGAGAEAIEAAYKAAGDAINTAWAAGSAAQIACALDAPDGFRERLVFFWADHFAVAPRGASQRELPLALMGEAIRPHVAGRFAEMLTAVVTHPAMLIYLDQVTSFGPGSVQGSRKARGLNENLARELLELHTLGVGAGYSQTDVRELAELLTGLTIRPGVGFRFIRQRAEPGAEIVLGESYPENREDGLVPVRAALQALALRPETARHLARKLAVHFVADAPDPGLVAAMEAAWIDSGGDLLAVYAALLAHPAAWAPVGAKARQPYDFTLAGLRALGIGGAAVMALEPARLRRLILGPQGVMGQPWQAPPGPDGWPEAAEDWITPQGLGARIRWAMEVPPRLVADLPDPRAFVARALGEAAGERLTWAAGAAESRPEGVGLVLASPDFNRR